MELDSSNETSHQSRRTTISEVKVDVYGEIVYVVEDEFVDNLVVFKKMLEDAEKPLYPNCRTNTKLSTLIKNYNIKGK